jgi:lysozyme family protein
MSEFESCVEYVLEHEGGFGEEDSDPGGATNFGISLRFLREVNVDTLKRVGIFGEVTRQTIVELTLAQAKSLYFSEFWNAGPFDRIMNGILAKYIFDMSVHHGLAQAVRITQRACCAAQKQKDYVKDDAIFGKKTLQAINQASFMLVPALIAAREGFMRQLVAVNPKLDVFLDGWLTRVYDVNL